MHWLQSLIYYIQGEGGDIVHHEKGAESILCNNIVLKKILPNLQISVVDQVHICINLLTLRLHEFLLRILL